MARVKPGQVSSLAVALLMCLSTSLAATDLPSRKAVPFVVDPFGASEGGPLVVGKTAPSDWMQFEDAHPRYALAYYSFNRMCRRSPICQGSDEVLCDITKFGKLGVIDGNPAILGEVSTSQACERTADLKRTHASMHDSLVFEDIEQFDGSEPRSIPKSPPFSSTIP